MMDGLASLLPEERAPSSATEDHRNFRTILSFIDDTKDDTVVNRVSKAIKLRDLCFSVPRTEAKREAKEAMDEKFLFALTDQDEELAELKTKWQRSCSWKVDWALLS